MMISTKGRYALRVMVDIAEHDQGSYISLLEISKRQNISRKYLESVTALLVKNHLLESGHGKGGGYKLKKSPEMYTVLEILEVTEDTLAPVSCLRKDAEVCERCGYCSTLPMWKELNDLITDYFKNKTLADLLNHAEFSEYSI